MPRIRKIKCIQMRFGPESVGSRIVYDYMFCRWGNTPYKTFDWINGTPFVPPDTYSVLDHQTIISNGVDSNAVLVAMRGSKSSIEQRNYNFNLSLISYTEIFCHYLAKRLFNWMVRNKKNFFTIHGEPPGNDFLRSLEGHLTRFFSCKYKGKKDIHVSVEYFPENDNIIAVYVMKLEKLPTWTWEESKSDREYRRHCENNRHTFLYVSRNLRDCIVSILSGRQIGNWGYIWP